MSLRNNLPPILAAFAFNSTNGNVVTKRTPISDINYALLATDFNLAYIALTASRTVTVNPALGTATNPFYFIVKDEVGVAATYPITIIGSSGTFDGAASKLLNANYGILRGYANGTNLYTW